MYRKEKHVCKCYHDYCEIILLYVSNHVNDGAFNFLLPAEVCHYLLKGSTGLVLDQECTTPRSVEVSPFSYRVNLPYLTIEIFRFNKTKISIRKYWWQTVFMQKSWIPQVWTLIIWDPCVLTLCLARHVPSSDFAPIKPPSINQPIEFSELCPRPEQGPAGPTALETVGNKKR